MVVQDKILQEDMEWIVNSHKIVWTQFQDATVLITGASGLLGQQFVFAFLFASEKYSLNLKVTALVHSRKKAETVFRDVIDKSQLFLWEQDMKQQLDMSVQVDYIIHGASITASKMFVEQPVETIETNLGGLRQIAQLAKKAQTKAVVFLSSMEIYGLSELDSIKESDYGYIDHLNVRSSYSEGKRMCECMCAAYAKEYQVPFVIARLTQTMGPGIMPSDRRVFAQFANSVLHREDIILHSEGKTVRNYCYTRDAVIACILLLQKGEPAQAYNIANEETEISVADMARMLVDRYSDGTWDVKFHMEDASKHGFNPAGKTCICCDKIKKLGWQAEVDLPSAYDRMLESMKNYLEK